MTPTGSASQLSASVTTDDRISSVVSISDGVALVAWDGVSASTPSQQRNSYVQKITFSGVMGNQSIATNFTTPVQSIVANDQVSPAVAVTSDRTEFTVAWFDRYDGSLRLATIQ